MSSGIISIRDFIKRVGVLNAIVALLLCVILTSSVVEAKTKVTGTIRKFALNLAVNEATNEIYATFKGKVWIINGNTNKVIDAIKIPHPQPRDPVDLFLVDRLAVNPNTNKVYVSTTEPGNLYEVDRVSKQLLKIALPQTTDPNNPSIVFDPFVWDIEVNSATNKIYVISDNYITIIQGLTNTVKTIPLSVIPDEIAVNEKTNKIYIISFSKLFIIDGNTDTLEKEVELLTEFDKERSYRVAGIDLNSNTNEVYLQTIGIVSTSASGDSILHGQDEIIILEGDNGNIIGKVNIGDAGITDIAVNQNLNLMYVTLPNASLGKFPFLKVADLNFSQVVQDLKSKKVDDVPVNILVNQVTNKAYISFDSKGAILVIEEK